MRYILSAFLVLMLAGASFAGSTAAPETPAILVDGNGNDTRTHPLQVTGDLGVEIGSITVDAFPVYSDASGNPATATVDANNRAVVNIGSDSAGITTTLSAAISASTQPSNTVATRTITLVANTAQAITTALPAGTTREFITISAMDIEKDFWLQFGGTDAVVEDCLLVNGRVSLPLRGGVDISIIASEAFKVFVLEGGKQ